MASSRTARVNEKIIAIDRSIPIFDIRNLPEIDSILNEHPNKAAVKGYYASLPVREIEVTVPDVEATPDRHGAPYTKGQFNAPLLTLTEWHEACKRTPDLLINANWYNVWDSGQAKVGSKMVLRQLSRTYLIGLSISNGKIISPHTTLDQGDVPLDSIFFDEDRKQVQIVSHSNIEKTLAELQGRKVNAVSGFITLANNEHIPSPKENNNIYLRLPRTGIGLSQDGTTITVLSIHNPVKDHGVNACELARILQALGCKDGINLDNSGSVELLYRGTNTFGELMQVHTQTCDSDPNPLNPSEIISATERPKPNFIGFRRTRSMGLFAYDDSDHTSTKVNHPENQPKDDSQIKLRS